MNSCKGNKVKLAQARYREIFEEKALMSGGLRLGGAAGTPAQKAAAKCNPWNDYITYVQLFNPGVSRADLMASNKVKKAYRAQRGDLYKEQTSCRTGKNLQAKTPGKIKAVGKKPKGAPRSPKITIPA